VAFQAIADFLREEGWEDWSLVQMETAFVVWWIFRPGATVPEMIGKLPRNPRDVAQARREAAALADLGAVADKLNVPRLLFQTDLPDDSFLFVQSGVRGRPLPEKADHFDRVLPWLETFQQAIPPGGTLADAMRRAITACRDQLLDPTPAECELLAMAEKEAPKLERYPAVAVHGDFWAGNVLDEDGRLGVLDWSNYHFGSPLEDIHNFAAAHAYDTRGDWDERMRSMWRVFFGDVPLMRRTAEVTVRMLAGSNLDRNLLRPLFLLFLISRISYVEFSNHMAWRRFATHYVDAGMPEPFTVTG
jgi:hypothetical protein